MIKKLRILPFILIPIVIILLGGSGFAFWNGYQKSNIINSKEFIEIALRSIDEADRLIVTADNYLAWGRSLLIAAGVGILIIATYYFVRRKKQNEENSTIEASKEANCEEIHS